MQQIENRFFNDDVLDDNFSFPPSMGVKFNANNLYNERSKKRVRDEAYDDNIVDSTSTVGNVMSMEIDDIADKKCDILPVQFRYNYEIRFMESLQLMGVTTDQWDNLQNVGCSTPTEIYDNLHNFPQDNNEPQYGEGRRRRVMSYNKRRQQSKQRGGFDMKTIYSSLPSIKAFNTGPLDRWDIIAMPLAVTISLGVNYALPFSFANWLWPIPIQETPSYDNSSWGSMITSAASIAYTGARNTAYNVADTVSLGSVTGYYRSWQAAMALVISTVFTQLKISDKTTVPELRNMIRKVLFYLSNRKDFRAEVATNTLNNILNAVNLREVQRYAELVYKLDELSKNGALTDHEILYYGDGLKAVQEGAKTETTVKFDLLDGIYHTFKANPVQAINNMNLRKAAALKLSLSRSQQQ